MAKPETTLDGADLEDLVRREFEAAQAIKARSEVHGALPSDAVALGNKLAVTNRLLLAIFHELQALNERR